MKLKLFLFALLGVIATAQAQNTGTVSGKITEKSNSMPISYATVSLKENGKIVSGVNTDDNGDFSFKNIALKSYTIEIQYIGFRKYIGSVLLGENKKSATLNIALEEEATQLKGVNIVAERSTIEQKIDRKVVTVGKDLTTAGASASDIMNNIPSVNVDQDGKLSLRGNDNVRVLIDGRPSNIDPAQLLKQIPSTSIKKIELITNPSAKYNPEGMSGIINIILHKNANTGFNGTYSGGITFGETAKYNQSLDLNYKTGKVNFFGNVGQNFGTYFNDGFIRRFDQNIVQNIDVKNDNDSYLYKIGMDYFIDDHNTISIYTNQNKNTGKGFVDTDIDYNNVTNSDISNIFQKSSYWGPDQVGTYNLAYKHIFKKEGHTLDFEGNYSDNKETQNASFDTKTTNTDNTSSDILYNDFLKGSRKLTTLNIDYVNPLNEKTTLEAGAEARITRTGNDYTTGNPLLPVESQKTNYTYDTDIYSAYVTFGQKFKKLSYQVGARFESYKMQANLNQGKYMYDDDYLTLYPSAYLTYNLNEKNTLQLSYSRRVDRPSLEQTKPIREFATPLVTSLGNPDLRPQFTNSVEVNYTKTLEKGSFTAGVFVRSINDQISRILYPDAADPSNEKQIMSFTNFDHNTAYGFEVSLNYKITKWWDIQPSIDFSSINQEGIVYKYVAGSESIPEQKTVTVAAFNGRMNSNFKVNKRLSFLLFGFYRGAVDGLQNNSHEMYKMDIGSRYTLLDNKMNISVRFNDVFNTMKYAFDTESPYPQAGQFTWESQTVYLGLTYNFGGGKIKNLQRKQRDDNTNKGGGGMF
ncbi:TonB-dependent receptor [Flavobacterium crocinum]|uniref:TonB-dependent receptor n=1 Tax=Flavobacterium crocinum TaxID=2183896 RepID=A0A2S1YFV8_9FLAO|nr:outer membrane beta-barrel family protein [Flavobacterium crocinum]AWK02921.1 TonB-dependent receptor [Flavobacterium crocinum]